MIARSGRAAVRYALYMPAMEALKYNPLMKAFAERHKGEELAPKAVRCLHAQTTAPDLRRTQVTERV